MVRDVAEYRHLRLALGWSRLAYLRHRLCRQRDGQLDRRARLKSAAIFPVLGGATGTAYFDLIQLMQFSPGPGAVTFMFDDGYKSTKSVAKPILDKYGFVGSSAAISSVVGTTGNMTAQDLRDLQAAGWDIASHSVTHPSMIDLSTTAAETELQQVEIYPRGAGFLTIDSFVWPYGDYNQSVTGLAQAGLPTAPLYKSARNVEFDDNAYGTFPYALKVLELVNTTQIGGGAIVGQRLEGGRPVGNLPHA